MNHESIAAYVRQHSQDRPDALFAADSIGHCSYEEAWRMTCSIASFLKHSGVGTKDGIVVECSQDRFFLFIDLACELLGAIFVPIEKKATDERVQSVTRETDAVLFVSLSDRDMEQPYLKVEDVALRSGEEMSFDGDLPSGSDIAEILFTTGTTGVPKGIEITNENNVALAENVACGVCMSKDNIEVIPLPISHSHGLRCCYANILNGSAMVLLDGIAPLPALFSMIEKYRATAMDISPSAVSMLMKISKGRLSQYREQLDYVQVGTAKLQQREKDYLRKMLPDARLYDFYGSTESGRTCVIDFNHIGKEENCIGKATKNARIIVTDEQGNEIESSRENTGLLAFSGKMNMHGYYRHPELTETVMKNGYVYTNDVGYIDQDGFVYILGRKGDIINRGGIKIAPEEIEDVANDLKQVSESACIPVDDDISGQVPCLFVVGKDGYDNKNELRDLLRLRLDSFRMPKYIFFTEKAVLSRRESRFVS